MDTPQPFATWAECKAAIEAFIEEWDDWGIIVGDPEFGWAHIVLCDYNLDMVETCMEDYFTEWLEKRIEHIKAVSQGLPHVLLGNFVLLGEYLAKERDLVYRIKMSNHTEWDVE